MRAPKQLATVRDTDERFGEMRGANDRTKPVETV